MEFGGIIRKRKAGQGFAVILSPSFPWSPTVLTSQFKLKIFISSYSSLLDVAFGYYAQFSDVELVEVSSLGDVLEEIEHAKFVVDEGWDLSHSELKRLSKCAQVIPVVKLESGYKMSAGVGKGGGARKWHAIHAKVGGVTDLVSTVVRWYYPGNERADVALETTSRRDLRSLLKSGKDGERIYGMKESSSGPVSRVVRGRKGEVSSAGLFPLKNHKSGQLLAKVIARFGSQHWVSRDLEISEMAAIKDIPEPLFFFK